jgi:hypothetical protein
VLFEIATAGHSVKIRPHYILTPGPYQGRKIVRRSLSNIQFLEVLSGGLKIFINPKRKEYAAFNLRIGVSWSAGCAVPALSVGG